MLKLQAVEISKTYRGRKVVDDVELEIGQGEVVGLLGPNGAGKTTTFSILVGLARPDSGRVLLNGDEITDLPMYLRARSGISYLPQEPSVFRQLTTEENLLAVLETLPLTPEQQRDRLEELLMQLGLETVRYSKAYSLSGGERRRLEIARSLTLEPSFMLLDEPFSGIDPLTVKDLQEIIKDLARSGIGVLIDRKSTRLNSSHGYISYAVFCLKKKNTRLNSSHGYISYAVFCFKKKNRFKLVIILRNTLNVTYRYTTRMTICHPSLIDRNAYLLPLCHICYDNQCLIPTLHYTISVLSQQSATTLKNSHFYFFF